MYMYESPLEKMCLLTCAPSEDSGQPAGAKAKRHLQADSEDRVSPCEKGSSCIRGQRRPGSACCPLIEQRNKLEFSCSININLIFPNKF